jgi:hypothetical protein
VKSLLFASPASEVSSEFTTQVKGEIGTPIPATNVCTEVATQVECENSPYNGGVATYQVKLENKLTKLRSTPPPQCQVSPFLVQVFPHNCKIGLILLLIYYFPFAFKLML